MRSWVLPVSRACSVDVTRKQATTRRALLVKDHDQTGQLTRVGLFYGISTVSLAYSGVGAVMMAFFGLGIAPPWELDTLDWRDLKTLTRHERLVVRGLGKNGT